MSNNYDVVIKEEDTSAALCVLAKCAEMYIIVSTRKFVIGRQHNLTMCIVAVTSLLLSLGALPSPSHSLLVSLSSLSLAAQSNHLINGVKCENMLASAVTSMVTKVLQ